MYKWFFNFWKYFVNLDEAQNRANDVGRFDVNSFTVKTIRPIIGKYNHLFNSKP